MSLLEDVFLEDEAGEAQELERIIEGDEYEERARDGSDSNENSEKEDEAEEDKRRIDPGSTKTKRVVKNPRFILNPARLTGPRGIQIIPEHFKDFKFKGKGHEKEDLDIILKKLEHWAYRLYPKFKFEDSLKKIETLGKKRPVMVHLHKIRSDQLVADDHETVVQKDSSDDEAPLPPEEDEFDQLLQQQIELARATPAPGDKRTSFNTPAVDKRSPLMMPKATSSPSISDEQRERMLRNRKMAEERRLARLKADTVNKNGNTVDLTSVHENGNSVDLTGIHKNGNTVDLTGVQSSQNETNVPDSIQNDTFGISSKNEAKRFRPNVIDSSDEDNEETVDEAVTVGTQKAVTLNTIDLTEVTVNNNNVTNGKVLDNKFGTENTWSNAVDSDSDDENELVINEGTTDNCKTKNDMIDLTEPDKINKSNDLVTKENIVYDLIEGNQNSDDSGDSGDECEVSTVHQSVVVDIHETPNRINKPTINASTSNMSQELADTITKDIIEESVMDAKDIDDDEKTDTNKSNKVNETTVNASSNNSNQELLDNVDKDIIVTKRSEISAKDIDNSDKSDVNKHIESDKDNELALLASSKSVSKELSTKINEGNIISEETDIGTKVTENNDNSDLINGKEHESAETVVKSNNIDKIDLKETDIVGDKENINNNICKDVVLDELMDVEFSDDF